MVDERSIVDYDEDTVLVVVDMQNDFTHPDGSLYVDEGEEVVPLINTEIRAALQDDALVVFTQDWHPESTPHFEKDGGIWPVHCVGGTWGAEFYDGLDVPDDAPVVKKGVDGGDGYSAFSVRDPESGEEEATELGAILDGHGIEHVVTVGLAQDYCVKETVLDALRAGYETTLLTDLTRPVDLEEGDGARALEEMEGAGAELR
ncbi:MAG: isochorismatase family protein [Nitriliruptorales bacterium]|nr:isochorismatase family protein [Nitriliruptorales bacterium]